MEEIENLSCWGEEKLVDSRSPLKETGFGLRRFFRVVWGFLGVVMGKRRFF